MLWETNNFFISLVEEPEKVHQYSSDMSEIFAYFGGKVVILPHYVHTDNPQIGTVTEFVEKVVSCWKPETPAIMFISARPEGGRQQEVFDTLERLGVDLQ